jgi:hypothetical protein
MTFKTRVYEILELTHPDDSISRSFQTLIFTLIGLNVIALIVDSDSAFGLAKPLLAWFEALSVLVFSVEYLLRVWSCTTAPSNSHPFWGWLRLQVHFPDGWLRSESVLAPEADLRDLLLAKLAYLNLSAEPCLAVRSYLEGLGDS